MNSQSTAAPQRMQRKPARKISLHKELGLRAGDALLVVDVQQDFVTGSLAVPRGEEVIAPLNAYIAAFEAQRLPIFMSRDWHPANHCSFKEFGGPWPPHCVQDTPGADWANGLKVVADSHIISKATEPAVDAYSAFSGTALLTLLRQAGVTRLFVGGLATDYCVLQSVLSARANGFDVVVLADAIRGVNVHPGDETHAIREMLAHGAVLFHPRRHSPTAIAVEPPPRRYEDIGRYGFGRLLNLPFTTALERVIQALRNEGFGLLAEIDVAATLKAKLGSEIPPYRILGACNPELAQRALLAERTIGLLLPCNVVVREDVGGTVHVDLFDPEVLSELTDNEEVAAVAAEVRQRLLRVIDAI